jgi:putative PIN family toxin of toxin-antitoxin system
LKAVLDPNVIISAALSPGGSPARAFQLWLEGDYELVCSPLLLDELAKALTYSKLRKHIESDEADELIDLLKRGGLSVQDPTTPPTVSSSDPDDNYLIALAESARSVLVSGDRDLLMLSEQIPVYSPGEFLEWLQDRR